MRCSCEPVPVSAERFHTLTVTDAGSGKMGAAALHPACINPSPASSEGGEWVCVSSTENLISWSSPSRDPSCISDPPASKDKFLHGVMKQTTTFWCQSPSVLVAEQLWFCSYFYWGIWSEILRWICEWKCDVQVRVDPLSPSHKLTGNWKIWETICVHSLVLFIFKCKEKNPYVSMLRSMSW